MRELDERLIRDWIVPADIKTRVVYHYTSAAGLIGILSSGLLRGTGAAFLNDSSEVAYGVSICIGVLEKELLERSAVERMLLDRVLARLRDDASPHDVYVTSFSARRDVLSQWRGYGSADGRFCIGFQLSQFSERDVLQFPRPVEYAVLRQQELVRRAVALACNAVLEAPDDPSHAWNCVSALTFHLRRLTCSLKHAGFEEEQEWRSVTTTIAPEDVRCLSFEAARGVPRPYLTMLAGSRNSTRLPVVEVCIGPMERKEAALHATQLLLSRFGYADAAVTQTDIPFAP